MTEAKTAPIYSRRSALQLMIAGATGLAGSNLLGQPAFARTTTAKPTGRVVVGLGQEPTVFNPLMAHIEVDDGVHFSVFDALFRIDPQGVIRPNLALEVPDQKNGGISQDGLNWRIRLRDDARWHDGTPFSSEDVKFTLELIMNPNFRSWRTAGHALVRDITVISPTEISWRMEEAFAPYLSFLTETFIVPKHILGKESNPNNAAFNQAPVGTGPFKWGQRVAGDHLELVANPDYFGEGPHIEKLVFKYIPDLTVLYTQFKSGDIDLVGQPYITPDHYGEAKMLPNRTVTLVPRTAFESFYLNLERPQFKELAVREALYAAIDKEAIIQGLYYGVPSPTETFMPRQSFFFNPNLPLHQFDVNRAGKILDQAGWAKGADGIRAKNGVRLSFTNSTTSGDPLREQVQQYLQQTFAQLGVEMKISNLPAAVMWGEFWGQSKFDSVIVGSTYLIGADPDVTNRLHSRSIAAKGGRGSNNAQFTNPEVDALLDKGARTFDPEARRAIYFRVQELVRRDLPFLPLYQTNAVEGLKKGINGFVPNGNTRTESWNALAWYWAS
ncbi:peptide ABC transporter substrate-binding protein [Bradyrhizobium japonicum]|jgi:peptide/nickel transport system substrate-binding protein|uniref:peptide ABC transporter substrate-binding protein n=1 Tax=Bradyrhizobium TaxID=374 RepID=UPI0004AE062E|nr:peptide ABC transporter substrate-binding protein [Bradyrhizobium japonicum]MBR0803517.1 peptide ABC transporter substrate-binding protein [Bradyrhizobium japonicum]MCP1767226.1 peptide/nickel transport system substrate-binding protein [Bradyrhizobium japonicum]MCP1789365.1 peptide/nickel transport system substrate-binding protein [Bradyrhizobium japonicum]MCP1801864.1 peptide/nickel transport system substrate-binding protein [Bradyrhizobium japonicum]MCP1820175.1 peptide/nickel transport s